MIVIAAYDNASVIEKLLLSMNKTNNLDEIVLVVSTDPSKTKFIKYLKTIDKTNFNFKLDIDFSPVRGFESGAFIHAYKNHIDDYYIFLQDSLIVINNDWLNVFKSYRKMGTINAWAWFENNLFDSDIQRNWIFNTMGINDISCPPICIFGNIFQANRNDLIKIDEKFNLGKFIVDDKHIGSCGMERAWAYLAQNSGIQVNYIFDHFTKVHEKLITNKTLFNKEFYGRK